ncbi:CheY-like chemotaxis protein [Catenulispora sp. GP43]|uniref:SpoIIE family protein phosphatase n=1 Tax=Catenulispora sp. GP43 TaxID=3156263 RepID=UPI0035169E25
MTVVQAADGDPGHILVVEDNAANRYLLSQWLRRAGHTVAEAADGAEALDLLAGEGGLPEVAILDVVLPDMTGFELCRRIKAASPTADIPVVHVSAFAVTAADRTQGLHGGADAYLVGPVDSHELLATITAVLRYTRARRAAQRLAERLMLLNEATLEMHRATDIGRLADAAVTGTLGVLGAQAASVYLSLFGRPMRTYRVGAQNPIVSEPIAAELLEHIAQRILSGRTGVRIALMSQEQWRELVPGPPVLGDVLVAAVRAHGGRPPVCAAIAVDQPPSADDRTLLMQITQACALSLESLRNFAEEHALALELQRSFLPTTLPTAGIELAVRYVPASAQAEIGGDFYEAIQTPDGLLLAIGDVVGHSLEAAIIMGLVRHALCAYAIEGHPPGAILELLDSLLTRQYPRAVTVTMCLVLVEPGHRRLQVANAGHIPPLLLADGAARFVTEHGQLLGLGRARYGVTTVPVTCRTRLLLYTDGLVEVRTSGLDESLAAFEASALKGPEDLAELCDMLLDTFGRDKDDDIALLAADLVPEGP